MGRDADLLRHLGIYSIESIRTHEYDGKIEGIYLQLKNGDMLELYPYDTDYIGIKVFHAKKDE